MNFFRTLRNISDALELVARSVGTESFGRTGIGSKKISDFLTVNQTLSQASIAVQLLQQLKKEEYGLIRLSSHELNSLGVHNQPLNRQSSVNPDAEYSSKMRQQISGVDLHSSSRPEGQLPVAQEADGSTASFFEKLEKYQTLGSLVPSVVLDKMCSYAINEGLMPHVLSRFTGAAQWGGDLRAQDPFGIFMAFKTGDPLRPMTWSTYVQCTYKLRSNGFTIPKSHANEVDVLRNYVRRKWMLLSRWSTKSTSPEVLEIIQPQLAAASSQLSMLERHLDSLAAWWAAHYIMLKRDTSKLDLEVLELKIKLLEGRVPRDPKEVRELFMETRALWGRLRMELQEYTWSDPSHGLENGNERNSLGVCEPDSSRQYSDGSSISAAFNLEDWVKLERNLSAIANIVQPHRSVHTDVSVMMHEYEMEVLERLMR